MKTFTIKFSNFAKDSLLRTNFKTIFTGLQIQKDLKESKNKFIRLKEKFYILSGFAFKSQDYVEEGTPLIRISDVENSFDENQMVFLPEEYKDEYENYLLKKDDIIVSLTGDGKIKSDLVKENDKFLLNQRVGALRSKNENLNIKFYYYLINNLNLVKKQFYWYSNGKTQLNISPFDLLKIKIPKIPKQTQDQIVSQIEPIEKEIKNLKSQIKDPKEIINEVFAREFGFDLEKFEESKKEKFFEVDFHEIDKIEDLRFSVRFFKRGLKIINTNNFELKPIRYFLEKNNCKNIKKGKLQNIYKLIELADVDNNNGNIININEVDYIGSDKILFNDADILTAKLRPYLGKTILNIFDKYTIGTTEWIPIKLNKKINREYLFYILLSGFYSDFVADFMSGKQHPRVKPSLLFSFQIPNIPLSHQQKIVDEIKKELDKQEEIKKQIEEKRKGIDEIVEESVN